MEHPGFLVPRRILQLGVLATAALLGTATPAQTTNAAASAEAALGSWIRAFNSGESTKRFFSNDATLVRGNGVFTGSERIDDMERRESGAGLRLALKVRRTEQIAPDSVWAVGDYELTVPGKDGAAPQVIPGVSVHVLQRNAEGWQMRVSSFTRLQAPPPKAASAAN